MSPRKGNADRESANQEKSQRTDQRENETVRKQKLLRCGNKFYFVYEDDGSLVDSV